MEDAPVVWDPVIREFVPIADPISRDRQPSPVHTERFGSDDPGSRRHVVVPAPGVPAARSGGPRPGAPASRPPQPPRSRPRPAQAAVGTPRSPRPGQPVQGRYVPPANGTPPTGPRSGRRWGRVVVGLLTVLALVVAAVLGFGWWQFSKIPKVDVSGALSTGAHSGTNYLLVGTDSREGIDPGDPNAGAFLGDEVAGARTDTIMVLRVEGSRSYLLSIPRDLWVQNPTTGEMGRINSTYSDGPATLIRTVRDLGIPIHHYIEINFVSFGKIVDAVGGISIDFPYPARDTHSGLDIPTAGTHKLDGTQALAYVRSRYYEENIDGVWRTDPLSDLGRVERQRAFISALVARSARTWNPFSLVRVAGATGAGLRIDSTMGYFTTLALAWRLRGFDPESMTLPVTPRTTSGGAAVLELKPDEVAPIVEHFSS